MSTSSEAWTPPPEGGRGLRLAVVGLGSIGRRHLRLLRALAPAADLTACRLLARAPLDPEIAALADRVVTGLPALLDLAPQAAVVATPAPDHAPSGMALARAGAHLLVEKPLTAEPGPARELVAACRQAGRLLLVGYNLRYHPAIRRMRQSLAAGDIGRLLSLRAEVGQDLRQWRPGSDPRLGVSARPELGGGALLELSHELDLARWLGGEVALVSARLASLGDLDLPVEDLAELWLEYRAGHLGSVHLDMVAQPARRGLRLVGSAGSLEWEAGSNRLRLHQGEKAGAWRELLPAAPLERDQTYRRQLCHFLACLRGEAQPEVDGTQGLAALALVDAARRSHAQGRTLAPLDLGA